MDMEYEIISEVTSKAEKKGQDAEMFVEDDVSAEEVVEDKVLSEAG